MKMVYCMCAPSLLKKSFKRFKIPKRQSKAVKSENTMVKEKKRQRSTLHTSSGSFRSSTIVEES
jgi:hypothetical protein